MNYTTQKGLMTELQCQQDFTRCGIMLSQPIIPYSRYDYLADIDGRILKIQCKTANPTNSSADAISFPTSNRNWNNGKTKKYTGQIDFFYTCFGNQGYLIPIEDTGRKCKVLRFRSDVNLQNVSWAADYEIEKILTENLNYCIPSYDKPVARTIHRCEICGKEISSTAKRCVACRTKNIIRKSDRPDRDELKALIRNEPFTRIAENFGVSDNAIRKWCMDYGLPDKSKLIKQYTDEEWNTI